MFAGLSPCGLPLLAAVALKGAASRREAQAKLLVLASATVFIAVFAVAALFAALGLLLTPIIRVVKFIAGVLLVALGVASILKRAVFTKISLRYAGARGLGVIPIAIAYVFSIVSCTLPFLVAGLALSMAQGVLGALGFALGATLPMIAAIVAGGTVARFVAEKSRIVEAIGEVVLILVGFYLILLSITG